jgi:resuscitation-promoting factor RpfA
VIVELPFIVAAFTRPVAHEVSRAEIRTPLHDWTGVATCESGGDWHINTGDGYFGGVQESQQFWDSFGGRRYAARPDLATEVEQITVAEHGLAAQGENAWPICGIYLRAAA